jgi:hypothetical protein
MFLHSGGGAGHAWLQGVAGRVSLVGKSPRWSGSTGFPTELAREAVGHAVVVPVHLHVIIDVQVAFFHWPNSNRFWGQRPQGRTVELLEQFGARAGKFAERVGG